MRTHPRIAVATTSGSWTCATVDCHASPQELVAYSIWLHSCCCRSLHLASVIFPEQYSSAPRMSSTVTLRPFVQMHWTHAATFSSRLWSLQSSLHSSVPVLTWRVIGKSFVPDNGICTVVKQENWTHLFCLFDFFKKRKKDLVQISTWKLVP